MIWRIATFVFALLLAIALVPAVHHLREAPPPLDPAVRLTLDAPPGAEFGTGVDTPFDLAIGPSGREIVFAAVSSGETQLWRRPTDGPRSERIVGTTGATMPAYAPDGVTVWFFAEGKLRTVNLSTGERRDRAEVTTPAGASVRSDGAVLFGVSPGAIRRIAEGSATAATSLRPGERTHGFPMWAGGGDAFTYLVTHDDGRRAIRLHDGDEDVQLTRSDSHGIVSASSLLFVRDGALRAEAFDARTRRLGPTAATLVLDVGVSPEGRGMFAVSDRLLASSPPARRARILQWFSTTGEPLDVISDPADYWQVRLSPDERRVAVTMTDPLLQTLDVFTIPATGGARVRVSLALAADSDPVWSPDGQRIAFRSSPDGQPHIYTADGPVFQSPFDEVPSDWTPRYLLFHARSAQSGFDVWAVSPGGRQPRALVRSAFNEIDGRISPDGRQLAYASDEGGQFDIYVNRLDHGARTRVSTAGGTQPQWIAGGRGLTFLRGPDIMRVDLPDRGADRGAATPVRLLSLPGVRSYTVTRDGRRVLAITAAQGFRPAETHILVGWKALVHSQ